MDDEFENGTDDIARSSNTATIDNGMDERGIRRRCISYPIYR